MTLLEIIAIAVGVLGAAFAITAVVWFFVLFARGFDH